MKFCQFTKWIQIGCVAAVATVLTSQAYAQDAGTRIAVVNSEKVFNESNLAICLAGCPLKNAYIAENGALTLNVSFLRGSEFLSSRYVYAESIS